MFILEDAFLKFYSLELAAITGCRWRFSQLRGGETMGIATGWHATGEASTGRRVYGEAFLWGGEFMGRRANGEACEWGGALMGRRANGEACEWGGALMGRLWGGARRAARGHAM